MVRDSKVGARVVSLSFSTWCWGSGGSQCFRTVSELTGVPARRGLSLDSYLVPDAICISVHLILR